MVLIVYIGSVMTHYSIVFVLLDKIIINYRCFIHIKYVIK